MMTSKRAVSRRSRTVKALGLAAAISLTITACGGGDDDESDDSSSSSSEADSGSDEEADSGSDEEADSGSDEEADSGSDEEADSGTDEEADSGSDEGPIKLGILGQCEGAFGAFHEDTIAGVALALVETAGATVPSKTTALDGWEGAEIAGRPIELVGHACGDDTPDRINEEVRTLVEQEGAEIVIGPLSGDESIAIANYAKDHPEVTFIDGIAGAQEATLAVKAPNYFRFHGDGAQWNAGLGDIVHNEAGWDTVAINADDYSFGHTSAAGFIADFCAAGGEVVSRVFPPLGTTDYSSYIQQLPDPDEVDGYFWVVGGTGTNASLEAFLNAKGDLTGDQHAGNLFFSPTLASALGTDIAGAYIGGFASLPGDIQTPEITAMLESADATWDSLVSGAAGGQEAPASASIGFGFGYGYYTAGLAMAQALEAVGGDLSDGHEAFRTELSTMTLEAPYGDVKLDENRHGIVDVTVSQLVENENGEIISQTIALIPEVEQTFGGVFTGDPAPGRDFPECDQSVELPWQGNAIPVVDGVPQR